MTNQPHKPFILAVRRAGSRGIRIPCGIRIPWAVPLALLAASLLAFGVLIPWMGLYTDDWPFAYVNHIAGLPGVLKFISFSRPVGGWVFGTASAVTGTNFWLIHLILLLMRWVDALILWRLLLRVWPEQRQAAVWAALFFVVYPAFKQQPLAVEYTPHFTAMGILLLSLDFSLRQVEAPSWQSARGWAVLAWVGSFQVFIIEYFMGLEILRPLLMGLVLARRMTWKSAARRALLLWLPYLPVLAAFVLWRVFVIQFTTYHPQLLTLAQTSPMAALIALLQSIGQDVWTAGVAVWIQPLVTWPGSLATRLVWAALSGITLLGAGLFLWKYPLHGPRQAAAGRWTLEYAGLGLIAMLAAGWPFWITQLPVGLDFPWDRISLGYMIGACLLAAGLVGMLRPRLLQVALVAVLAAASVGLHFQNANTFRHEWRLLTDFYWQLTWRAPGLAPGTLVVLDQSPFNYHVDNFMWPILNWVYAPDSRSLQVPYGQRDFHKMWGVALPPKSASDPFAISYWTLKFYGDTGHMLMVVYSPPGCVRILTPEQAGQIQMSDSLVQSLALTNLSLVEPDPAQVAYPTAFLGPEPAREWCYYFEKASLAAQLEDWAGVARLADEAQARGFSPGQTSEWLIFAEGYLRVGRRDEARELAARAVKDYPAGACAMWERTGGDWSEIGCR